MVNYLIFENNNDAKMFDNVLTALKSQVKVFV